MFALIKDFFLDEATFRRVLVSLGFAVAGATSTGAGAEIMSGDFTDVTGAQWVRFAIVTVLSALGGAAAVQKPASQQQ